MATVLVVYSTHDGQTRKIAERIATVLRVRRHVVELLDAARAPRTLDLTRFEAVFIGSPIHQKGYLAPVGRFVRQHKAALGRVPTLFFSVGLAVLSKVHDGRAQSMAIVDKFLAETGWRPRRIELVAGALLYTRYNFLVRFVMRRDLEGGGRRHRHLARLRVHRLGRGGPLRGGVRRGRHHDTRCRGAGGPSSPGQSPGAGLSVPARHATGARRLARYAPAADGRHSKRSASMGSSRDAFRAG